MKRLKQTIIFLFFLILSIELSAQNYLKHEFSVGGFGGVMSLKHKLEEGKSKNKMSGGIGFGYTYLFKANIGLVTGLDFAFYNSEATLSNFSDAYNAFDIDLQKEFEFRYTLQQYEESQNAFYLNIPIMLRYQFAERKNMKFYANGGVKVGIPINGKYKTGGSGLKTSGYFPHFDDEIDDIPFRGFGDFDVSVYDEKQNYKMSFNLAIEAGAKWTLPKDMFLYTGLYLDYGLNDVNKNEKGNSEPLVQYNQLNPESHIYNGLSNSSFADEGGARKGFVSKVNTIGYGIKVSLAFGR